MEEWRRYTGTQFLQAIWTIFALAVGAAVQLLQPVVGGLLRPSVFLTLSGSWIVGLILIALYDRRNWNRMVRDSSFKPDTGTRIADIETIKKGRSVTGNTHIPNVFSQEHMTVRTPVEGVGASFTMEFTYVGEGGAESGITTGNDALDDAFVIRGTRENVTQLLSPEIQAALMELETAGRFTITGSAVEYEIPFTRLSAEELETIATVSVELAERIEELASA